MKINNIKVVPRNNSPTVLGKTALEFFYVKNGEYVDPYEVCSVVIFKDQTASSTYLDAIANGDPDVFIDYETSSSRYGLVASSMTSSVYYRWENRNFDTDPVGSSVTAPSADEFNTVNFGGDTSSTSGIFKIKDGHFAVALSPLGIFVSSVHGLESTTSGYGENQASAAATYFDIWTVVDSAGMSPRTYVNKFYLYSDTILALTEPLLFTSKNSLVQKYVNVGSKVDLKVRTDLSLNDKELPKDVRSIFEGSVVQDAQIRVRWYNESDGSWETQVDWRDVDNITSRDTLLYSYTFSTVGRYDVQVKYSLVNETIYSDKFNLVCR